MIDWERFRNLVRLWRGKRSVREVADSLGMTASVWSSYEIGKRPGVDIFFRMCDLMSINPNELRLPAEVDA